MSLEGSFEVIDKRLSRSVRENRIVVRDANRSAGLECRTSNNPPVVWESTRGEFEGDQESRTRLFRATTHMTITNQRSRTSLRQPAFIVVIALQFALVTVNGATTMALPAIRDGLQASSSALQWYASLFALGFALVLVLAGRLGDLFGTRRLLLIGYGGLIAAGILSAFAPTIEILLVARLLQGIAGGLASPQLSAMIQRLFTGHNRTRAFAVFLMFAGGAFMIGQLSTGALISIDLFGAGWRWAYIPFIPIGLVSWLVAIRILPATERGDAGRLDLVGAAVLSGVAFLIMFPLIQGRNIGWPLWIFAMLASAVPAFMLFLRYERVLLRSGGDPLVNPVLFAIPSFRTGNIVTALVGLLSAAAPLYLILTIQLGFGRNALEAAILTCPMPFANMFGSMAASSLMRRFGRGALAAGALATMAAAFAVIIAVATQGDGLAPWQLVPGIALLGFALGISIASGMALVLSEVPQSFAGSASGVQSTGLQLSSAIGIAVIGVAFYGAVEQSQDIHNYLDGIEAVMWATIALTVLQLFFVRFLPRHERVEGEEFPLIDPELLVIPDLHGDSGSERSETTGDSEPRR